MARSKSYRNEEDLKGLLRQLKAENKSLKRRLRQLEKNKHIWEEYLLEDEDQEVKKDTKEQRCPECGEGILSYVDLGIKHLMCCNQCKYRTKAVDK